MGMTEAQMDTILDRMESELPPEDFDKIIERNVDRIFHEWVLDITLDNREFSFADHEYLIEPYREALHRYTVEIKSTQMGLTTKAMLLCFYLARYGPGLRGILYLFPGKQDVMEFSKGRINPLIDDNPESIGSWLKDTDNASIKRVWNTLLYFRGMRSRVGLKGIPIDFTVVDELDEGSVDFIFWAKKRMSHALVEDRRFLKLSNPTLPDYGIDLEFQASDQHYRHLKCPKCNHYTNIVRAFASWAAGKGPEILINYKGAVIRACEKCHSEITPSSAIWIADQPSVTDIRGYQYSQLFANSKFIPPREILEEFHTTKNISDFWNLTIGLAHVEAENRLTEEEVLALCGMKGIPESDPGPCYMGVDVQKDGLFVTIGKKMDRFAEVIYLGIVKEFEELDGLIKNFRVIRTVICGKPEGHSTRNLARRHPGRVFMYFDNIHQKGAYNWDKKEYTVSANRTEGLDSSHQALRKQRVVLPKNCEITQIFAKHCHNIARKLEEIEELDPKTKMKRKTGQSRYVWVKLTGDDHFRFAFNLFWMAFGLGQDGIFSDLEIG